MSVSAPPTPIQVLLGRIANSLRHTFPKVLSASSREDIENDGDPPEFEVVFAYRRGNSTGDQQVALFIGGGEGESAAGLQNDYRYEAELHEAFVRLVVDCIRQNNDTTEAALGNICTILEGRSYFASRSYTAARELGNAEETFGFNPNNFESYFTYRWVSTVAYVSLVPDYDDCDEDCEDECPKRIRTAKPREETWAERIREAQRISFIRKDADLESLEEALRDELPKRPEREVCDCSRAHHKEAPEDSWNVRKAQAQFPSPKGDKKRKHR